MILFMQIQIKLIAQHLSKNIFISSYYIILYFIYKNKEEKKC